MDILHVKKDSSFSPNDRYNTRRSKNWGGSTPGYEKWPIWYAIWLASFYR